MDFLPTAEVIREMAEVYRSRAEELDELAEDLVAREDFSYAAAALMLVSSTSFNLRLDLLVTRPLRELGYAQPPVPKKRKRKQLKER